MPAKDPEKRKAYQREYYRKRLAEDAEFKERHRSFVKRSTAKARAASKDVISEFRKNGCVKCGEREEACLDAHHIEPDRKDFNIGDAIRDVGMKKLKAELEKCVCLCANCHRKVHAGIFVL